MATQGYRGYGRLCLGGSAGYDLSCLVRAGGGGHRRGDCGASPGEEGEKGKEKEVLEEFD